MRKIFNCRWVWWALHYVGWGVCFVWDEYGEETAYLCRGTTIRWRVY